MGFTAWRTDQGKISIGLCFFVVLSSLALNQASVRHVQNTVAI